MRTYDGATTGRADPTDVPIAVRFPIVAGVQLEWRTELDGADCNVTRIPPYSSLLMV
jgi:hypothetical protein